MGQHSSKLLFVKALYEFLSPVQMQIINIFVSVPLYPLYKIMLLYFSMFSVSLSVFISIVVQMSIISCAYIQY